MRPFRRYTHGFPWISPVDVIARTPLEPCGPVCWTGLHPHIVGRGMDPRPAFHVYRLPDDFLSGYPYGKRRLEHMDLSRRSAGVTPRPCDGRTSTRYDRFGCRRSGTFASVWNPLVSPRSKPGRPFAVTSSRYHHQGSETTSLYPWLPRPREGTRKASDAIVHSSSLPCRSSFGMLSAPANSLQPIDPRGESLHVQGVSPAPASAREADRAAFS